MGEGVCGTVWATFREISGRGACIHVLHIKGHKHNSMHGIAEWTLTWRSWKRNSKVAEKLCSFEGGVPFLQWGDWLPQPDNIIWYACYPSIVEVLLKISPGDSLRHKGSTVPRWVTKKLWWWLKARFKEEWTDSICEIDHSQQEDMILCAICTGNSMAHWVSIDTLWNAAKAPHECAQWFNHIAKPIFRLWQKSYIRIFTYYITIEWKVHWCTTNNTPSTNGKLKPVQPSLSNLMSLISPQCQNCCHSQAVLFTSSDDSMDSIVDIPVRDSKDVGSKSEKGSIISNNWDLSMESDNELEILSCHSQHSIDIDGDLSPSGDLMGNHESTSSISQVARSPSVNSLASRESKAKAVVAGIFELTKRDSKKVGAAVQKGMGSSSKRKLGDVGNSDGKPQTEPAKHPQEEPNGVSTSTSLWPTSTSSAGPSGISSTQWNIQEQNSLVDTGTFVRDKAKWNHFME